MSYPHATVDRGVSWRAWASIVAVWLVLWLEMSAPWGVLILAWVFSSLRDGSLVFVDVIDRRDTPLLYWSIQATWVACGLYFIWLDLGWWLGTGVGAP